MKYRILKKDTILNDDGVKLYRIQSVIDFGKIKTGALGGYIEKENNLSQYGDAWISGDAQVYGDAWVYGNAQVCNDAIVYGNAQVYGDACVGGHASVHGDAQVYGDASLYGNAEISGAAEISGDADILHITGLGLDHPTTTVYKTATGVEVVREYFRGTLDEFVKKIEKSKFAREDLAFVEVVKIYFGLK